MEGYGNFSFPPPQNSSRLIALKVFYCFEGSDENRKPSLLCVRSVDLDADSTPAVLIEWRQAGHMINKTKDAYIFDNSCARAPLSRQNHSRGRFAL
ncbi:hypothetical protein BURPSPAST_N0028 [Burkholderia pseudomallei Pasteur 52237]|nr:hypothetical protein BURPSPAST_N0028 [Burkholderia pseudomallei Pasteur 52237]